ncbi:MAG: hypothetical protein ACOY46_19770 [Bacillota bacterium]
MAKGVADKLKEYADEGNRLLREGFNEETEQYNTWYYGCRNYLIAQYNKNSSQVKGFKGGDLRTYIDILMGYASQEEDKSSEGKGVNCLHVSQTQTTNVHQNLSLQVQLNIEYSDLPEESKQEAKNLLAQIEAEIQKPKTNWQKVSELLKNGFDYGLKIALPLAELVAKYYQVKANV